MVLVQVHIFASLSTSLYGTSSTLPTSLITLFADIVPKVKTHEEYFRKLTWDGIKERYGENFDNKVKERTEYELGIIFHSIFIMNFFSCLYTKQNFMIITIFFF